MAAERAAQHRARDERSCIARDADPRASACRRAIGRRARRGARMRDEHAGTRLRRACARAAARSRPPRCRDRDCRSARRPARSTGRCTSARAIATRCSSPPESSRGMLPPRSARPTASSIAAHALVASRAPVAPSSASGSATFCATVRYGSTWKAWNTKPIVLAAQQRERVVVERRELAVPRRRRVPASGALEPGDEVEQRRLADAGLAEDRDQLAGRDRERDVVEHDARARTRERLRDAGRARSRRAGGARARRRAPPRSPASSFAGESASMRRSFTRPSEMP